MFGQAYAMPDNTHDPLLNTQPVPSITSEEKSQIIQDLVNDGLFKVKTEYILIGDEPRMGAGVVNLKSMLKPDDYSNLKKYLTLMPRSLLWDFFMKKIWPSLPEGYMGMGDAVFVSIYGDRHARKDYETLVWAAFIDLFNEANLEHVNKEQIEPWAWEQKKTEAYYVSSSKAAIDALEAEINSYADVSLALDPKAKVVMEAYMRLPRIGDTGLEINRQNAIKELLKKKDYVTAQAVVDAFRYINDSEIGIPLTQPIPYDIQSADGAVVVKAT